MQRTRPSSVILIAVAVIIGCALALAGSQHGWTIGVMPGFAIAVAVAFVVQWVAFIPAAIAQTDRYFDATGSVTYISVTAMLLLLAPALDARSLILGALVIIWAVRLGSFLLARNLRSGGDDRFDEIKRSKLRFLSVWTVQGLWVSLTAAAAWITIASANTVPLGSTTRLGLAI